jgi:hypothetical protein
MADTATDTTGTTNDPSLIHWPRIASLPSTNWKALVGTVVTLATMLQYFALQWFGKDTKVSAAMWDSWLTFVALAVLAVPAAQYVAKRMTFEPGGPDDARAAGTQQSDASEAQRERGADIASAAATPTPVLVATRPQPVTQPATLPPIPGQGD